MANKNCFQVQYFTTFSKVSAWRVKSNCSILLDWFFQRKSKQQSAVKVCIDVHYNQYANVDRCLPLDKDLLTQRGWFVKPIVHKPNLVNQTDLIWPILIKKKMKTALNWSLCNRQAICHMRGTNGQQGNRQMGKGKFPL